MDPPGLQASQPYDAGSMDGPEYLSEKNIPAQIQIQKCHISLESATLGRQRCWGPLVAAVTECAVKDRIHIRQGLLRTLYPVQID